MAEPSRFPKSNPDILYDEITTIDNALTRPWTVLKTLRRERNAAWTEYDCNENNNHVAIGKEAFSRSTRTITTLLLRGASA